MNTNETTSAVSPEGVIEDQPSEAASAIDLLTWKADVLEDAQKYASQMQTQLRDAVVDARTSGILTVPQIATAIKRDRNAVDTIWSAAGMTVRGKQTRVEIIDGLSDEAVARATTYLAGLAERHRDAVAGVAVARQDRDNAIASVYGSKALGPSTIAGLVGIDRNHVLRCVRKAGIAPAYRTNIANQHTIQK